MTRRGRIIPRIAFVFFMAVCGMEVNWEERRYTAVTNDAESTTCTAMLSGREAVALLGALREVEGIVLENPFPCSGTPGAVKRELDWFIPEHLPPDSQSKHAITAVCAARYPALDEPFATAAGIFRGGDRARECRRGRLRRQTLSRRAVLAALPG